MSMFLIVVTVAGLGTRSYHQSGSSYSSSKPHCSWTVFRCDLLHLHYAVRRGPIHLLPKSFHTFCLKQFLADKNGCAVHRARLVSHASQYMLDDQCRNPSDSFNVLCLSIVLFRHTLFFLPVVRKQFFPEVTNNAASVRFGCDWSG
jgi:hypothetical protein